MYQELIVQPLYNLLVLFMSIPGIDVGMAVILFTILVRFILYPLSKSALLTQVKMKKVEPELNKIRSEFKDNKQMQAQKMMEFYKVNNIKPFSSILLIFIQLPILFALISVFYKIIPTVDVSLLYSFVANIFNSGSTASPTLFGLDLTHKHLLLALFTAVAQYFQLHYSLSIQQTKNSAGSGKQDMASQMAAMSSSMKYFMPVLAFVSLYWFIPAQFPQAASVIAIYWSISTIFTLAQELYIRKKVIAKQV